MKNLLPVALERVPSKSEVAQMISEFDLNKAFSPIQKFILFKGLEELIKQGIDKYKKTAIQSFFELNGGAMKGDLFGVSVQITNERKDVMRKRYQYSDEVSNIELNLMKAENEVKLMKERLKLQQTMEINGGIATEIADESSVLHDAEYGIKITLAR